ncbi:MAG: membrane or secreted protein [Pirellulaceae bacterium]|nr:membrane or secreted protein [Pirellulaceae bacterium]
MPAYRLLLLGCVALSGCAGGPFARIPGTILQQRLRASVHDPYLDPDAGPNAEDSRPRDFQQPLPEPVRNRVFADTWLGR